MTPDEFVRDAWTMTDEAQRKEFVRAHIHALSLPDVERAVVSGLETHGWKSGLIMVALRILQVQPSDAILHHLMAMVSEGATFVPGGSRLRTQLDGHIKGLLAKQPVLAESAKRYRRPDWAKRPSSRKPVKAKPVKAKPVKARSS